MVKLDENLIETNRFWESWIHSGTKSGQNDCMTRFESRNGTKSNGVIVWGYLLRGGPCGWSRCRGPPRECWASSRPSRGCGRSSRGPDLRSGRRRCRWWRAARPAGPCWTSSSPSCRTSRARWCARPTPPPPHSPRPPAPPEPNIRLSHSLRKCCLRSIGSTAIQ